MISCPEERRDESGLQRRISPALSFSLRSAWQLPSLSVRLSEARLLTDKEGSIERRRRHLARELLSREALIKALSNAQV